MAHYSALAGDLVDGRLSPDQTREIDAHLLDCPACRDQVESQRLIKSRLAALSPVAPSHDFLNSLFSVGGVAAGPAPDPDVVAAPMSGHPAVAAQARLDGPAPGSRRPGGAGPAAGSPTSRSGRFGLTRRSWGRRPARVRMMAAVVGSASVVGAGILAVSVISPTANQLVTPSANFTIARHVVTMGGLPMLNLLPAWRVAQGSSGR